MEPTDKPFINEPLGRRSEQTAAELHMSSLTAECLRDIARNDSAQKSWRKAAIKFLMDRQHKYQYHSDFRELREELLEESNAENEVKAIVESAVEAPIESEVSLSQLELGFESSPENKPASQATINIINSILQSKVPEENFLRDEQEDGA